MSATVTLRAVERGFVRPGERTRRAVLHRTDLHIESGELLAVVGPSGSGKSTLVNLIAGLIEPDAGTVDVRRHDGLDARISVVFQQPRLLDWLDATTNVRLAADAAGIERNAVSRALQDVGLETHAHAFPSMLSGGQRQRVAVARAFVVDPDVVLFDEPFSALDELTARRMRLLAQDLWRKRPRTGVLVTHNTHEAAFLADRIVTLDEGRIVSEVRVERPRPRALDDPRLFEIQQQVLAAFG